jgi:hypothetical protein
LRVPPPRSPAETFAAALDAYRAGRHFEAHERWEDLWRSENDAARKRYLQGLIQVAAAMHKLHRTGDRASALRLLGRARPKLGEVARELDVAALCAAIDDASDAIEAGAPASACAPPMVVGPRPGS